MGRHGKLLLGCALAAISVSWAAVLEEQEGGWFETDGEVSGFLVLLKVIFYFGPY